MANDAVKIAKKVEENLAKSTPLKESADFSDLKKKLNTPITVSWGESRASGEWDWGKLLIWFFIIAICFNLVYFYGQIGGILSAIFIVAMIVIKSPILLNIFEKFFGFLRIPLLVILFTGTLLVVPYSLSVYANMPGWIIIIIEIIFIIGTIHVNELAGGIALAILLISIPILHSYVLPQLQQDSPISKTLFEIEDVFGGVSIFSPAQIYESITRFSQRSIAEATGDLYTSNVDSGAKKNLGVFMEDIKTTQKPAVFLAGDPLTFFSKISAQSLGFDVNLKLRCEFASNPLQGKITPASADFFKKEVVGEQDSYDYLDVDCVLPDEYSKKLSAGAHTVKIMGTFNFATHAYQHAYFIDKEKLKDLERRNLLNQWTSNLPENAFTAITTKGPVKIGLGIGSQPIGIGTRDTEGPTVGISMDNSGSGHVTSVSSILLILPKGLSVKDVNGNINSALKVSCIDLDDAEQKGCDDKISNNYRIDVSKVIAPIEEGSKKVATYDFATFRVHTKIEDYNILLGSGATLVPKKIKATVAYDYEISKESSFSIRAPK